MSKNSKTKPERKVWHRVKVPKAWKAQEGEEIEGVYIGTSTKQSRYDNGDYKVHHIRTGPGKVVFVTGSICDALFSVVKIDTKIKLVFNGYKPCSNNSEMKYKDYEMFSEEAVKLQLADHLTQAS